MKGQLYEGYAEVAIRPTSLSQTFLNETVSLELVAAAGQPAMHYSYVKYAINGGTSMLRLMIETPGFNYGNEHFGREGVIYKALVTGSFHYAGDDPLEYADSFKQMTRMNQQDLAPVIRLIKFVGQSTDEEFDARIGAYVDLPAFASYCAIQALLNNFDDMSGPGVNYYLWYDLETEKFTILTWDLNLALSSGFGAMREFQGTPPDGKEPGGSGPTTNRPGPAPSSSPDATGTPAANPSEGEPPTGKEAGPQFNGNTDSGGPMTVLGGPDGADGGRIGNPPQERFMASALLKDLYNQAFADAFNAMYGSGFADAKRDELAALATSSGLVAEDTITTDVASLHAIFDTLVEAGPVPSDPTAP